MAVTSNLENGTFWSFRCRRQDCREEQWQREYIASGLRIQGAFDPLDHEKEQNTFLTWTVDSMFYFS